MPRVKLSFLGQFSLVSFLFLLAIAIALAWGIQQRLEQNALQQEAESTADQVATLLNPNLELADLAGPIDPVRYAQVDALIRQSILHGRIVRVKIWSRDGLLVYSDEKDLVGRRFPITEDLAEALAGKIAMDISTLGEAENVAERGRYARLLEVYVPLRPMNSPQVAGAYETYADMAALEPRIAEMRLFIWGGVGFGFLILYGALFTLVRNASRELVRRTEEAQQRLAERMQAEAALIKLSSAVEQAADHVLITNKDGIIEYVNPAFEKLTGYTKAEALGKTPRILKSGKHPQEYYQKYWDTLLSGKVFEGITINKKKNGELYHEEKTITPILDPQGNITHFVSVGSDITQRIRTEQELQHRADEFAALYETTRDVAVQRDLPTLLQAIVERATALLAAPSGVIFLYDASRNDFGIGAAKDYSRPFDTRVQLGEGITGRIAQTRQPVIMNDYPNWEGRLSKAGGIDPTAVIGVPLFYGDEMIGTLEVAALGDATRKFSEADARLLSLFAGQAAAAVHNARLFEETQRRAEELALVNETASVINQPLLLNDVLANTLRELTRVLGVDRGSVAVLAESRDHLTVVAGHGVVDTAPILGMTIPLRDNPSMDYILRERRPLAISDAQNDPILGSAAPVLRELGMQSILILPLISQEQVIGTIGLDSVQRRRVFSDEEITLAQTIAHQAAAAIEKARLFEEEQTRRKELAALYDLSRDLADSSDFDAILDLVARHAVETIRVTFARVAIQEGDECVVRAAYPTRIRGRDLEVDRRAPAAALSRIACHGVLEQDAPVVLGADSPDVSAREREMLFLDLAQTVCLVPLRVGERSLGFLMLGEARSAEREPFTPEKIRLARSIGDQAASALQRAMLFAELEHSYLQTVLALANSVDAKDTYTADHAQRLAQMALAVGRELGMTPHELEDLRYGAILHDIGKIGVPDAILRKPAKLDADEWVQMRQHPAIGSRILAPVPRLAGAARIVCHHHERFDGKGYPDGLAGEAIPLGARILTVVDSYSAIMDARVYKAARSQEEAIAELRKHAGTQFDPRIVQVFLQILGRGIDITGGGRALLL